MAIEIHCFDSDYDGAMQQVKRNSEAILNVLLKLSKIVFVYDWSIGAIVCDSKVLGCSGIHSFVCLVLFNWFGNFVY